MTPELCGYVAGIIDGEGWIGTVKNRNTRLPCLQVRMTDQDVVQRVADAIGCSVQRTTRGAAHHQPLYQIDVRGAKALDLLDNLYPLLGARRRARIDPLKKELTPVVRA